MLVVWFRLNSRWNTNLILVQGQALIIVRTLAASQNLNNPNPCTASEDGAGVGGRGEGKPCEERKQSHALVQLCLLSCIYTATGPLYLFQLRIRLSSDFCCCRSGPCFLLLNAIKHNVLRLRKHFKLLHIWFCMLDRFILNINVFYDKNMWKCIFVDHCVGCEQNLNPGFNHNFNFVWGYLQNLWEKRKQPVNKTKPK